MCYIRANMPAMPRVKSDQERGATGVWLRRERQRPDRQWTPDDVVKRLADMSYPIRVDYYRGLESGAQKPGPELMAVLRRLYGSEPAALPAPVPSGDQSDVAAAVREQTAVMRELLGEMRAARETAISPEALTVFLRQLQSEGWLTVPETPASTDAPAPRARAKR